VNHYHEFASHFLFVQEDRTFFFILFAKFLDWKVLNFGIYFTAAITVKLDQDGRWLC